MAVSLFSDDFILAPITVYHNAIKKDAKASFFRFFGLNVRRI
jgi:hypothetical protein